MLYHPTANPVWNKAIRRLLAACALLSVCVILTASRTPTELEKVLSQGTLTIASRNGPTTYYEGPYGLTGYEYALASEFAKFLGVKLEIVEEENLADLFETVKKPDVQMIAAGITATEERANQVDFSSGYFTVTQQVIYRSNTPKPGSINDFIGKNILVIANSSHSETLRRLKKETPELEWREDPKADMLELVEMVHNGTIDYTIIDSNAFAMNKHVFPRARVAFDITEPEQLAWAFQKQADKSLQEAADRFLNQKAADGTLAKIEETHYNTNNTVSLGGALLYAKRIDSRLPKWEAHFRDAGDNHGLDWQLLAALSYQESHWDKKATSPTGVRGLMMLTKSTAKELGVSNRLDPAQSIDGGAKYFKKIFDRLPADIQGPDRTWMALAAYNVGYGHMEDARVLTEKMGGDPDKWQDVRKHLPLLAIRKYYSQTKHGYARGWEPVKYVKSIRHFYNILAWNNEIKARRLAAANEAEVSLQEAGYNPSIAVENTTSLL